VDVSTGGGTLRVDMVEPDSLPFYETYSEGTIVALEAVPSFGYAFKGWERDISSTDNPEFIIMDCNKYITAGFQVDWRVVGTLIVSLIMVIFLVVVLIIRRKSPEHVPA
jgi:hypothetical protein